jgi:serine/threonine protein kinase
LLDAGSTGGTFVADTRITKHLLRPGDSFRIGDSVLRYSIETSADATTLGSGFRNPPPTKTPNIEALVNEKLADFELESILARGSSGVVFRGKDTVKNRLVAVKVLTPDLIRGDEQKERFVRAMKTTLPIRHPHIVRLYNAGKKGPFCWVAMEFVDGESLTKVIQRIGIQNMLDWREVYKVAYQIGNALEEAYQRKIIHRNVTPANILRRSSDKVCLLGDLMLAKGLESTQAQQVTQPGQLIGELAYMSPERTQSDADVDCRSDLYGLGATLYALLTGKPPVEGETLPTIISNIRKATPAHPKVFQLSIHERFADLVMTLLEKSPSNRFQTPRAMLQELENIGRYSALVTN